MCPLPEDKSSMRASEMVCELENMEARRLGVSVLVARTHIARRLNEAPGSLENLRRGRAKSPRKSIVDKLCNLFVAELSAEIRRLENEIALVTRSASAPEADAVLEAQACIDAARKLIRGK